MKIVVVAVTLLALPFSLGFGQVPVSAPRQHSLSLEAQSVASGGTTKVSGGGTAKNESLTAAFGGSPIQSEVSHVHEKRDSNSQTNLQVDIRNFGQTPDNVRLEWYFVAAPVGKGSGNAKDFIFDHGGQEVSIVAGGTDTRVITSKEARIVQQRSATVLGSSGVSFVGGGNARGTTKEWGISLRGWFVRLVDNGQIVATRGSSQAYEDLAKDESQLQALLAEHGKKARR